MIELAFAPISGIKARALGLKRYFTAKPCKRGHIALRLVHNNCCEDCARFYTKQWQLKNPEKKLTYITEQPKIKALLKRAFKEKRKVKITYYSLSSDEVTNRIIDIYQLHNDCVVAFCNLRDDERTFVMSRINKAAILDEKYSIPKGWSPESIILNN